MSSHERIEVYTDGQCPLCQWLRARVEPFDRNHRIEWINYREPEKFPRPVPYTFEELNEEMHVYTADGRWSEGYRAWLDVMRVLPRWRALTPVLSIWPVTSLGNAFYRWLASRRYKLFGIPPPCDADGVCALHKSER